GHGIPPRPAPWRPIVHVRSVLHARAVHSPLRNVWPSRPAGALLASRLSDLCSFLFNGFYYLYSAAPRIFSCGCMVYCLGASFFSSRSILLSSMFLMAM